MTDADRLLDTADTETERLLLRAGRSGAPSQARERALLAATTVLAASSLAAGGAAAGNAALGAKAGSLAALGSLKWLAVAGVVGVGAAASAVVVRHATSAPTNLVVEATPAPADSASAPTPPRPPRAIPRAEPEPPPAPAASTAPLSAREPGPPSSAAPVPSSNPSFADELGALDGARSAIDVGEPARALSILEGYRARFPNGSMRPEATILRIEALERAGDHAAAVRTADAFLAGSPKSPYAARVRSLVGGRIDDRRVEPEPLIP